MFVPFFFFVSMLLPSGSFHTPDDKDISLKKGGKDQPDKRLSDMQLFRFGAMAATLPDGRFFRAAGKKQRLVYVCGNKWYSIQRCVSA